MYKFKLISHDDSVPLCHVYKIPTSAAYPAHFQLIVSTIKSTHSHVKDETYFEICFAGIPETTTYHYYPSKELFIKRSIYFSARQFVRHNLHLSFARRFPLRHTR